MEVGGVTPAVNQYHVAVGLGDTVQHNISQVKAFCAAAVPPIGLEAFSTLSSGCMGLPTVQSIAVAHNVSAAMVCLRWIVQQGMSVVVSSDEARFDREDLLAASTGSPFVLSDAEMVRLSALRAPAAAPQRQRLHSDDDQAALSPCTGNSTGLASGDCAVWRAVWDSLHGRSWNFCSLPAYRDDPCHCHWATARADCFGHIECSAGGSGGDKRIIGVVALNNNLTGQLPDALFQLPELQTVWIHEGGGIGAGALAGHSPARWQAQSCYAGSRWTTTIFTVQSRQRWGAC